MVAAEDPPLDEVFHAVVDIVHALPPSGPIKVSTDEKLKYYGLFKQATEGPCTRAKPSFWNVIEGYKWDSWNKLGDKDSEECKREYVDHFRTKLRKVSEEYSWQDWMQHDDWDKLEPIMIPKFKMLVPDLVKKWGFEDGGTKGVEENGEKKSEGEEKIENGAKIEGEEAKVEENGVHEDEKPVEPEIANYLSDDDYCDAVDAPAHVSSPTKKVSVSFCEAPTQIEDRDSRHGHRPQLPPIPSSSSSSAFTRYAMELQQTVSILSDQIHRLSNSMAQQNNVIRKLVENSTAVMFFGMSWKQFVFLLVWPIVVHVFLRRYVRR
ncbi:hypothetical protein L596_023518 [Steinernema carpocapsae]|uniref:ACB domain-containing protein n=1 Tax=Steinernema carpocapsae TaxID=34508 RepID=A0A4U5ME43_STECR|nr:hypothetical protein L596_023518 [Steinernema carpocapsae]